jgi:hypothetical protein
MNKRSHKNTPRLTARERAREIVTDGALHPSLAYVIERALQAHARDTLSREKRRLAARLSQRTRDAIKNAREYVLRQGQTSDYLDAAILELAKGLRL